MRNSDYSFQALFISFCHLDSLVFLNILILFSLMPSSSFPSLSKCKCIGKICHCHSQLSSSFLINSVIICFRITKRVLDSCTFSCCDSNLLDQKIWSCNPDSQLLASTLSDYSVPYRLKIIAVYTTPLKISFNSII